MVVYQSINFDLRSCADIKAKIAKIDEVLASLTDVAIVAAMNGDTIEYTLDTGQSKIHKIFSSQSSIKKSIMDYEQLRTYYVNKLSTRVTRLVDGKNFRGQRYGSSF